MPDTTIPTWSAETLVASLVTANTLTLTWSGAGDTNPTTGDTVTRLGLTYKIYRGSSEIAQVSSADPTAEPAVTYDVTGLRPGTTYTFSVQAVDAAGNASTDGPSTQVTTLVADYFQLLIKGVYSKNSNYSDPKIIFNPSPYTVMPTEFIKMTVQAETSVGSDIDTSIWDSISLLMVKNLDTTLTLQVYIGNATHTDAAGGSGFRTRVAPGGVFVTTDVLPGGKVNVGDISGSGDGSMYCEVTVVGS